MGLGDGGKGISSEIEGVDSSSSLETAIPPILLFLVVRDLDDEADDLVLSLDIMCLGVVADFFFLIGRSSIESATADGAVPQ